jgi:two-component system heavy metal sensor histidine kinase CusS
MRFKFFNAITVRTSLLFTLLAGCVFMVMGIVIHASVNLHFEEQDKSLVEGKLELVRHIFTEPQASDDQNAIRQQLTNALIGHHDLVVRINGANNRSFFSMGHATIPDSIMTDSTTQPLDSNIALKTWQIDGENYRGEIIPLSATPIGDFTIAIGLNTLHHEMFLHLFQQQLIIIGCVGLLLMAILGWLAARRGLQPIEDMAQVATTISATRLEQRLLADEVPIELKPLALAFNGMLERLENSFQRLSDFSADLAHELRTPINNLMTQTQVSLSKLRSVNDYQEVLYSNLEEYDRLARMISDMLFLAKADEGLLIPRQQTIQLADEVAALFDFYDALAADKSIQLEKTGDAMMMGDQLMIRRALSNLLANAIRYAPTDDIVSIVISNAENGVEIRMINHGADIPADQIDRLFDRFYRGDASRLRHEEGAGLGLAITQSIIEAHHGTISVTSANGTTEFLICFKPSPS